MGATPQESQQIIDNTAAIKAIQDGAKKVSQLPTLTSLVNSQDKIPLERADTGQTVYTTIEQLKDGGVSSNTVKHPITLSFSSDKIEKGALRNMFGGLDKVVDADTLSNGNDIVASGGRSKLMFVVNAGTDVVGDLKITGTKVDRDTGVSTPGFEEIISIDSLSIDNSTTDTFGNIVHDFSNCYTSTEWFTNGFTISTTDLDISDIDIYNVAFNQFGDMEEVTIDALDLTAITTNANAEISGHAYTVRVANGKTTIETFANMELPAIDFNDGFYRFRNAVNETVDTRTDGVFVDINFMPFIQSYFENMSFILWAHENETINITVDGSLGLDNITYGENLTNGTLVYLNTDGKYYKADNTSESTSTTELRLIIEDGLADEEKLALAKGQYTTTSLTAGLEYVGVNGTITNSRPTLATETVRIVSTAIDATTRYFDASKTWINGTASKINGVTIAGAGTEFLDNVFKILNSADQTRKLEFDLSQISSGTTRTATLQDKNGVIAFLDDIIQAAVEEAPIDGKQYARKDAGWVEVEAGATNPTRVDMGISNDIDWAKPNGIFLKTLTENTTFTDSNLPNGLNIKRISLHLEPNVFNPIFPNYWELISGDIINNNVNVLKAECVNGTSGSELVRYSVESSINLNDYSGVFNSDSSVINGLIDSNAPFPTTFYKGTELFTIIGRGNGQFTGWKWNINTLIWESNTVIVNGLGDIGSNACPSVFYIDNDLYMIASENLSQVGFKWNTITNNWDSNTGILVGLGNIWGFTAGNMTVFSIGSTHYCIIGGESYRGYKWNGVSWDSHTRLSTGLPVGTGQKYTCISYYIGSQLYLILGNVVGDWNGFYWNGFSWIEDVNIVTGLADTGSWSRASIYYLENKLNIIAGDTLALNGYSKDK